MKYTYFHVRIDKFWSSKISSLISLISRTIVWHHCFTGRDSQQNLLLVKRCTATFLFDLQVLQTDQRNYCRKAHSHRFDIRKGKFCALIMPSGCCLPVSLLIDLPKAHTYSYHVNELEFMFPFLSQLRRSCRNNMGPLFLPVDLQPATVNKKGWG